MSLYQRLFIVLAGATLLVGCRPSVEGSLSPDGKLVAEASSSGLRIRPSNQLSGAQAIVQGRVESPLFSPTGESVAYEMGGKAFISGLDDGSPVPLAGQSVLCFNEDGRQIATSTGRTLFLQEVQTGKIIAKTALSISPSMAMWIPNSRGVVVANARRVVIAGETDPLWMTANGDVEVFDLGWDASERRVRVLVGISSGDERKPAVEIRELAIRADHGNARNLRVMSSESALATGGGYGIVLAAKYRPGSNGFAVFGIVDKSPPGLLDRYLDLEDRQHRTKSPALAAQVKALEKRLVVESRTVLCEGSTTRQLASRPISKSDQFPYAVRWSRDGSTLLLNYLDAVQTIRLD